MEIRAISNHIDNVGIVESSRYASNSNRAETNTVNQQKMEEKRYTEEELIEKIESANKHFVTFDRRLEFSIHEKTKQIMVKVIDLRTEEIIREIPPEKILDMVATLWEIAGIIVDEKI